MTTISRETIRPPSRAQLEALAQYVEGGLTMDELASRRGVSIGTVEQQLRQCRIRLEATTSAQAYAIAVAGGMLETTIRAS